MLVKPYRCRVTPASLKITSADWPPTFHLSCDPTSKNRKRWKILSPDWCEIYPILVKWKLREIFREAIQVKDAVLFSAEHKEELIQALQMDTYEPPMTQVLSLIFNNYIRVKADLKFWNQMTFYGREINPKLDQNRLFKIFLD